MADTEVSGAVHPFLQGGGEMGARTRQFDWSKTSLGCPGQWPQGLRTATSILLNSQFPMFVWWGPELVTIYNDSYKIIAGDKHPHLLGKSGREAWAEIWPDLHPLVEDVFRGNATWSEDLRLYIKRSERVEETYFTFSYSPILNESGTAVGLFCACIETTEKVFGRRRLEESEQILRNIILKAPIAMNIFKGPDFVVEMANDRMFEVWGRQGADVLGKPIFEAIPEAKGFGFEELLSHVYATGETATAGEQIVTLPRDGKAETAYVTVVYAPYHGYDGALSGVIAVAMDVTEQVTARKKIEESEARYRSLFYSMEQGYCVFEMISDEKGRPVDYLFLEVNPQFERHTGLKDAAGKRMRELVPHHYEHWFQIYGRVAVTGQSARFEQHSAALARWFDLYAYRPGGPDSRRVAVLFTDITERKLFELTLLEKDANLRNIIQHAPVAMFIFRGEDLVIDTANAKALEMIQRSETVIGKPLLAAIPELKGTAAYGIFLEVFRTGVAQYGQELLAPLQRNGVLEDRYFNFAYTPFLEAGQVVGVMYVATEVTDQVLARQKIEEVVARRTSELAAANKELQRSNARLEEFAHAASHDLKEPIRKIHFFTDRLKKQLADKLSGEDDRMFGRVEDASRRMNSLIDDLLLYSHVSQKAYEKATVDLNEQMRRVLEDLELNIEEKKAEIRLERLPEVQGHKRQLEQLFQNLLANALKYNRTDVTPQIQVTTRITTGEKAGLVPGIHYHVITIRDNGIGFEQAHAGKIFEMFQRLHGKNEYAGTGVGLSIAQKIAENHDGRITAESAPGEGAAFHLFLPVAPAR